MYDDSVSSILSTGTRPAGVRFLTSVDVVSLLSGMRSSSKGTPIARSAMYGLKLQLDQFLVPMASV